jgi:hypothetical protein
MTVTASFKELSDAVTLTTTQCRVDCSLDEHCNRCDSEGRCLSCTRERFLFEGACVRECPEGHVVSEGESQCLDATDATLELWLEANPSYVVDGSERHSCKSVASAHGLCDAFKAESAAFQDVCPMTCGKCDASSTTCVRLDDAPLRGIVGRAPSSSSTRAHPQKEALGCLFDENCHECRDESCAVCRKQRYLLNGECMISCPSTHSPSGRGDFFRTCEPKPAAQSKSLLCVSGKSTEGMACSCPKDCALCDIGIKQSLCIRCVEDSYLLSGECVSTCPIGYTERENGRSGRSCIPSIAKKDAHKDEAWYKPILKFLFGSS